MYALTKKHAPFEWTSSCEEAFNRLKTLFTQSASPRFSCDFCLETDASGLGLGAVLSQEQADGTTRPIAYASRTLQLHERNYSTTEMEALGVVWAVRHFRHYLYGHRCHVHTDHEALKSLLNSPHPSGKLARWGLAIQELDLVIHYKPGRINQKADVLSRSLCPTETTEIHLDEKVIAAVEFVDPQVAAKGGEHSLEALQREDPTLSQYFTYLEQGILPEDETVVKELVLTTDQYELVDGVLYHLEKRQDFTSHSPSIFQKEAF